MNLFSVIIRVSFFRLPSSSWSSVSPEDDFLKAFSGLGAAQSKVSPQAQSRPPFDINADTSHSSGHLDVLDDAMMEASSALTVPPPAPAFAPLTVPPPPPFRRPAARLQNSLQPAPAGHRHRRPPPAPGCDPGTGCSRPPRGRRVSALRGGQEAWDAVDSCLDLLTREETDAVLAALGPDAPDRLRQARPSPPQPSPPLQLFRPA
jgi:hypothetical protein